MALRDSMRASAAQFIDPGEIIEAVMAAQTRLPMFAMVLALLGALIDSLLIRYRMIVVTNRRILVLDTGKFSVKKARSVLVELPRSTRLGPASGIWYTIPAGKEKLKVHRRFFSDIDAADNAIPAAR